MDKQTNQDDVIKRILGYTRPYRLQLMLAFTGATVNVIFTLLIPVIIGKIIDEIIGINHVNFDRIIQKIIILTAVILISSLFQWIMNVSTRKLSSFVSRNMRNDAFEKLNRVPLKFIDANPHGDIISRLVNDADAVSEGLLQGFTQLFPGVATIIGTLVIMLLLNVRIALVVIIVTPLSIVFAGFVTKRTNRYFTRQSELQGELSGYINEMVTNKDLVSAFNYQKTCMTEFNRITDDYCEAGFKAVFYSSVSNPGTRFVNSIVFGCVCVLGAIMIIMGNISIGQVSAFLTYANQYTKPFNEVTSVFTQLQTALASARRMFHLIDADKEPEIENPAAILAAQGNVHIDNISFRYHPDVPLIENFKLDVKSGQRIAIVGPTGCGKTTLINLLMRFYDVDSGDIRVDDTSIYQIQRKDLRDQYGMVLQETWLKNVTVRENIAYGKPDAAIDEIIAAANSAHAHGFIKRLENGYDTVIAPEGSNLSAGQRQLLCIARIMLCQPDMLILDEATSSIDTRTEMLIQQAFEKLMKGRTSFIVAHRLSTIQTADVIIVMNQGHIIEQGNHQELLAQKGFYYELYNSGLGLGA